MSLTAFDQWYEAMDKDRREYDTASTMKSFLDESLEGFEEFHRECLALAKLNAPVVELIQTLKAFHGQHVAFARKHVLGAERIADLMMIRQEVRRREGGGGRGVKGGASGCKGGGNGVSKGGDNGSGVDDKCLVGALRLRELFGNCLDEFLEQVEKAYRECTEKLKQTRPMK